MPQRTAAFARRSLKLFVHRAGQDYGPYTLEDLRTLSLIWYGVLYGNAFLINQLLFLQPLLALVTIILWFPVLMWVGAYLTGNYAGHLCESGMVERETQM